jgi:hypothetical protein
MTYDRVPNTKSLSPPRAGGRAVCLDASGLGVAGARGIAVSVGLEAVDRVGERGLAHAANSLACGGALAVLLVGGKVERNEEQQVRAQDHYARDGRELLTRALTSVGEPRPVGRGEVGPRGEVHEAWNGSSVRTR